MKEIPDIISDDITTFINTTFISTKMLRDPNLSAKAKGILCTLISITGEQKGIYSEDYKTALLELHQDGISSITNGIEELEKQGYIARLHYREKKTKRISGLLLICTDEPGDLDKKIKDIKKELSNDFEIYERGKRKNGKR